MEQKKLKSGFTTGACAAAAARAAAQILLTGEKPQTICIELPENGPAVFPVLVDEYTSQTACCAVKKDAGDDPDVTNGVLVYAKVSRVDRKLYKQIFDRTYYRSGEYPCLFLTGGEGIGIVTKAGLSCEPGYHAINPVPRRMIFSAVGDMLSLYREKGTPDFLILIEISVPAGAELAGKTFNPKLGIVGGISILGTTGVVNPMSEQALVETIRLEIRVKKKEGKKILAVAPGNYGETFLKETLGVSMDRFIKCSNFIGDTFSILKEEQIGEVLLAGHIGKLIKVAGGVLNTHSRYGDGRMEIFAACALGAGLAATDENALRQMNTTEEAVDFLHKKGCLSGTIDVVLRQIREVLRTYSGITAEVLVFSNAYGVLGMTQGAGALIKKLT